MENCTIYYEDTKHSCQLIAEKLSGYEGITCKKASEFTRQTFIFEGNSNVGFIFESDKEKVPYAMKHIIWRIVMDKANYVFVVVTGGAREFEALKCVNDELSQRGYGISNLYSKYIFEKNHLDTKEVIHKILQDMETQEAKYPAFREKINGMSKKELRKVLKSGYQEFRCYKRKNKKGL